MSISVGLTAQVQSWIAQDPDSLTRAQLTQLFEAAQSDAISLNELKDAFSAPLEFGTAGLRGLLGAGPNRMNRITVLQAASGLAEYLVEQGAHGKMVVIGFDARYNSAVFAKDTARVMAGAGLKPLLFSHVVPTPVLAFSILHLGACAAVMVTASHNPAQDNGYKVYLRDGRQIVAPVDAQISMHIRKVIDVREVKTATDIQTLTGDVMAAYVSVTSQLVLHGPTTDDQRKELKSVYTAMHGVGWQTFKQVALAAGFTQPTAVPQQRDPDPTFATVAFPNPEEEGALDLALALADKSGAHVLIANDPDADRLAIALPLIEPETSVKTWKVLRGDQIGSLLGWWIVERFNHMLPIETEFNSKKLTGTLANSIVSSMMLEKIAKHAELNYENTLTGFKWVSRVDDLLYGYEEALGYCVDPKHVRDKDGISAALMFMEMMTFLAKSKKTPWNVLAELAITHGLHATDQVSVRVTDLSQVGHVMSGLRSNPPNAMGDMFVDTIEDLAQGLGHLPATDAIIIYLVGNGDIEKARVIIRPSGTEPKIKCYLEVVVRNGGSNIAQQLADDVLRALARDAAPLLDGGK